MKVDMTPQEAASIVATACDSFESEEVEDVIFVVKRQCKYCHKPHVITVFGTPEDTNNAIVMMAHAIQTIAEEGTFDV